MNTAPQTSASTRAASAGFATLLTLAMLLGINMLTASVELQPAPPAQMAASQPAASAPA